MHLPSYTQVNAALAQAFDFSGGSTASARESDLPVFRTTGRRRRWRPGQGSATWGRRHTLEPSLMNSLAANRTAARPPVLSQKPTAHCSFVEDLNWPAAQPTPTKKTPRPTEMWVPGPNGQWEGVTPTLQ